VSESFLASQLPRPHELKELPPDVVGVLLLRLVVQHGQGNLLTRSAVANPSYWREQLGEGGTDDDFIHAMAEAWDWLIAHGLIALRPGEGSMQGWSFVTRRGHSVANSGDPLALVRAEERLSVDLHPRIGERIRRQFLLGEYEPAAFIAMREVEIRLRELANADNSEIGVKLAKDYLRPDGALADPNLERGEQEATMALFWGALGVFKNPSSHRQVEFADATLASEVILLADLLLRLLDQMATPEAVARRAFQRAKERLAEQTAEDEQ